MSIETANRDNLSELQKQQMHDKLEKDLAQTTKKTKAEKTIQFLRLLAQRDAITKEIRADLTYLEGSVFGTNPLGAAKSFRTKAKKNLDAINEIAVEMFDL